jgi:hypothetical protein
MGGKNEPALVNSPTKPSYLPAFPYLAPNTANAPVFPVVVLHPKSKKSWKLKKSKNTIAGAEP